MAPRWNWATAARIRLRSVCSSIFFSAATALRKPSHVGAGRGKRYRQIDLPLGQPSRFELVRALLGCHRARDDELHHLGLDTLREVRTADEQRLADRERFGLLAPSRFGENLVELRVRYHMRRRTLSSPPGCTLA